jgi:hypothetical protein
MMPPGAKVPGNGPRRPVTAARLASVLCRTVHLAAFAVLFGGHVWGVSPDRLLPALWLTLGSGVALMAFEMRVGARWLRQGRGLVVLVKLGVLALVPLAWEHRVPILLLVVVLGAVGSHLPARFRHATPLDGALARLRTCLRAGAPAPERASRARTGGSDGTDRPPTP